MTIDSVDSSSLKMLQHHLGVDLLVRQISIILLSSLKLE